tara:strand:- start:351 stop:728 length:378 start_codon:yes stop_codon:yes gene_type:complete
MKDKTNRKLLCRSNALTVGGRGIRFEVTDQTNTYSAFVVRSTKGVASFVNQCTHLALELDWNPGEFFDADGQNLVCATHGALYNPITGACVGGACSGKPLQVLTIIETGGCIYLEDEAYRLIGCV